MTDPNPSGNSQTPELNNESQEQVIIDKQTLITEIAEMQANPESVDGSKLESYKLMLKAILDNTYNDRKQLKADMNFQLKEFFKRQAGLSETHTEIFSDLIDRLIESVLENNDKAFVETLAEFGAKLKTHSFQSDIESRLDQTAEEEAEEVEAGIADITQDRAKIETLRVIIKHFASTSPRYKEIEKLLDSYPLSPEQVKNLISILNSILDEVELPPAFEQFKSLKDILAIVQESEMHSNPAGWLQTQLYKIPGVQSISEALSLGNNVPAFFRVNNIYQKAAEALNINIKSLKILAQYPLEQICKLASDDGYLNSIKNSKLNTHQALEEIAKHFGSGESEINELFENLTEGLDHTEVGDEVTQYIDEVSRDSNLLTLELYLIFKYDHAKSADERGAGHITTWQLIGQRSIQAVRMYRTYTKSNPFERWGTRIRGFDMRDGQSRAAKNPLKGVDTQSIFDDLKSKVKNLTGPSDKLKDVGQADFHTRLGQFNGYIEQYMDHARKEQIRFADEIAKATKVGDAGKVSLLIEQQEHHMKTHAKAQADMRQYTDLYTEGSRQRSRLGKSVSKSVGQQITENIQEGRYAKAGTAHSEVVGQTKRSVQEAEEALMREVKGHGKLIRRAKVAGVMGICALPQLFEATGGDSGSSQIAANITETAGMFIPIVGTLLTLRQAVYGKTLAGDELGFWERMFALGFGITQGITDVLTVFGGVGLGLRAALVTGVQCTKASKALIAAERTSRTAGLIANVTSKFATRSKLLHRYGEKLRKSAQRAKEGKIWGNGFKAYRQSAAGTFRAFAGTAGGYGHWMKQTSWAAKSMGWTRNSWNNKQYFRAVGKALLTTVPATLSVISGVGRGITGSTAAAVHFIGRPFLQSFRRLVQFKDLSMRKVSAIISGVGNAKEGYKGAEAYFTLQRQTAQIIKHSADITKSETKIINLAKSLVPDFAGGLGSAIGIIRRKGTSGMKENLQVFRRALNTNKKEIKKIKLSDLKFMSKDAMKVFTQLSKGETPGALSNWITKVSNNSKLISKSARYTENAMLGALGLSIGKSLFDNYYSPEDAQGTAANFADITSTAVVEGGGMALDSAAFLLFDSGRGFSRQTWYNKVDMIAMKQALNKRAFAKLAALSDAQIAMLYFDESRLKRWFRKHLKSSPISLRAFEDFVRAKGLTIEKLSQLYRNEITNN